MQEISLIIHDLRSIHNVGSLFRTADGMGVQKIYLTGYTPGPTDRFGRNVTAFTKVSLGAEESVLWEKKESLDVLIRELQEKGVQIVALEQAAQSISLSDYNPDGPVALIVGNEVEGLSKSVLNAVDVIVEIPMKGKKESLNVASAGAVALYALSSQ